MSVPHCETSESRTRLKPQESAGKALIIRRGRRPRGGGASTLWTHNRGRSRRAPAWHGAAWSIAARQPRNSRGRSAASIGKRLPQRRRDRVAAGGDSYRRDTTAGAEHI